MPITPLIHITAAYSNALLVAILPHVSDCAKQLDLPLQQPITASQVGRFNAGNMKGFIGAGLWLTNNYWFTFVDGYVAGFRSPDDFFTMADEYWDHQERYVGQDNMTTNEAIQLARDSFRKLGYKPADFGVEGPPTETMGPDDIKKLGHIPCFRAKWESPEPKSQAEFERGHHIWFDIDLQRKQVVAMSLISRRFFRPDPKIDVVPELESDYRKRMRAAGVTNFASPWAGALFQNPPETNPPTQAHLFIRTNAPPRWLLNQGTNPLLSTPPSGGQETKQE